MLRKPIAAGMFYANDKKELEKQIVESFLSEFGPGELPADRKDKKIVGIIVPHAGYYFSGAGQAHGYKEVAEAEEAELYIIIGTAHSGFQKAAVCLEDFETPLGIVKADKETAKILIAKGIVIENSNAHEKEHSIEVQLPFLQFINKEKEDKIRIVPIVVGQETDYENLGKIIAETIKKYEKKAVLICSSDFTHYGISYGYVPFKDKIRENIEKLDKNAAELIKKQNAWGFLDYTKENKMTICGAEAIAVFITACAKLGANDIRLENYYISGDVNGDWSHAVGYWSIIADKNGDK